MAVTPFSNDNKKFSDDAHIAARKLIYPRLFKTDATLITYEDQDAIETARGGALDGDMSIDRVVKVTVSGLRAPLTFTFQERFRRPEHTWRQDITLTEWNTNSNLPSEFYKISANYFLYGYYDDKTNLFSDAICVNVAGLLTSIVQQSLTYERKANERTNQPFLTFRFDDLHKAGIVTYRQKEIGVQSTNVDKVLTLTQPPSVDNEVRLVSAWLKRQPIKRLFKVARYINDLMEELYDRETKAA